MLVIAAVFFLAHLAVSSAQEPFQQLPPGYFPNGQYPNGQQPSGNNMPGGHGPFVPQQPTRPTATFGGPASPDAPDNVGIRQGTAADSRKAPVNYLAPGGPASGYPGQVHGLPTKRAPLCDMSLTLGRVGDDVVLTGDLLHGINDMMSHSRVPPEKRDEQRTAVVKEVTDAIHDYAAHVAAGDADPAKGMSESHRVLMYNMTKQSLEIKMLYQDFRKEVPKEGQEQIQERVDHYFEDNTVKDLLKRENVTTTADLENALRAKGSSMDRERKSFTEQFLAHNWMMQKVKGDDGPDITHEDMVEWYHAHIKEFEQPARVRWEELMISFAKHPHVNSEGFHDEAYAALSGLGNRVIAGASLDEVARASSEGATAHQGGQWDWTRRGSLDSKAVDDAIFSLPTGTLSPILEATDGFHIVRVVEHQEATTKSFLQAQKTVKERVENERLEKKRQEYLKELRGKYPIWTVFDAVMKPAEEANDDNR